MAMQLKDTGNGALRMGDLGKAIEFYDAALQIATTPEEARTIKLNRSLANLRMGCYDKTLEDAGEYTNNTMVTEKGLYRAAWSLYELDSIPWFYRIISLNAFESSRAIILKKLARVGVPKAERAKPDLSCGLYINASHINHSCYSNARRSFIGDVLILRATRDIPAGEEILFWYALPKADHSYEKTQEKLRNWDFCSSCVICTNDQETSNKKKKRRVALVKEVNLASHVVGEAGLAAMERLLAAIEQTYTVPATSVPRLALWDHYLALTRVYASIEGPERTITTAWKVVAAVGFVIKRNTSSVFSPFQVEQWGLVVDPLIETWVHLWMAYKRLVPRRPELCNKAEEYARMTYKICIGEDETFEEQVGRVARKAICEGSDLGMASLTLSK